MGAITAVELRERFVGIFSAGGSEMCEELFKEMAMLVPHPMRKVQLLQLCPNVSAGAQAPEGRGREWQGQHRMGRGVRAQNRDKQALSGAVEQREFVAGLSAALTC